MEAPEHFATSPDTFIGPAQLQTQRKKKQNRRALILSTLPLDFLNLSITDMDPMQMELTTATLNHLQVNSATEHKYSKLGAEALYLTPDLTIHEHAEKHSSIRTQ